VSATPADARAAVLMLVLRDIVDRHLDIACAADGDEVAGPRTLTVLAGLLADTAVSFHARRDSLLHNVGTIFDDRVRKHLDAGCDIDDHHHMKEPH
jgi:hypothetical protein